MKEWHNTVCLDFDGVIAKFGTEDAGEPVDGVFDGMIALLDAGWYIEIYSGRSKTEEGRHTIINWLFDNARLQKCQRFIGALGQSDIYWESKISLGCISFPANKPVAKIYVDDRGLRFTDWKSLTPDVLETFRAWWQHPESTK